MQKREVVEMELNRIEASIREIDMGYEKYFMGIERRPPEKERDALGLELRRLANRYIPQTDLRYRYQTLATRYHSYCANWERLMRQIEEGKFVRKLEKLRGGGTLVKPREAVATEKPRSETEQIIAQITALQGKAPDPQRLAAMLAEQRAQLSARFGGREIEFLVVHEDGKPKIKARPKAP